MKSYIIALIASSALAQFNDTMVTDAIAQWNDTMPVTDTVVPQESSMWE